MNSLDQLRDLYEYNAWATRRLGETLSANECAKARRIFAHLLTTEEEYFERLEGMDSTGFDFWPDLTIEECLSLARQIAETYAELLENAVEEDLDRIAAYRSSESIPYENSWRELLTHVVLHSSIHRGNIMLKLRESGIDPPKIDHIIYLRERS